MNSPYLTLLFSFPGTLLLCVCVNQVFFCFLFFSFFHEEGQPPYYCRVERLLWVGERLTDCVGFRLLLPGVMEESLMNGSSPFVITPHRPSLPPLCLWGGGVTTAAEEGEGRGRREWRKKAVVVGAGGGRREEGSTAGDDTQFIVES